MRFSFSLFLIPMVLPLCTDAQSLRCERIDTAAETRAESLAELIPDIVLRCSAAGSTAAAGTQAYQVIVNANTAFANRDLVPIPSLNWAWNDALLLVGDPPPSRQIACVPPDGQPACQAASNANVFQGKRLEETSLVFQGVLIATPEAGRSVTLRIANLRVNASAVASAKTPEPVTTNIQIFGPGGGLIAISGAERISATTRSSLRFALRNPEGLPVPATAPAVLLTPRSLPLQNPDAKYAAQLNFRELFPNAFRRRNAGSTSEDPRFLAAQSIPGADYNTETGFYNPALSKLNRLNETGLADTATRLVVQFEGIPENTALWVNIRDNSTSASARALLVYTDSKGAGAYNPMSPWVPGWAQLYSDGGKATAAWEIVGADPEQIEEFSFGVTLTALNGNPGFGVVKATGLLGPVGATNALPSFRASSMPGVALPLLEIATSVELPRLAIVSTASLEPVSIAPDSLMTAVSSTIKRAAATPPAGEIVDTLQAVAVDIIDALGRKFRARALDLAPGQFSFLTPTEMRTGPGVINLIVDGSVTASESILVEAVAPALFSTTGDGIGYPVGEAIRLGGGDPPVPLARFDEAAQKWSPVPIPIESGKVYITVLATGVRNRAALASVAAAIGGKNVPAILANPHPELVGVDSVTVGPLPQELAGMGRVKLAIRVDGKLSQELSILLP
jgi:uncharacterized protein (TIGR03437 family)